MQKRMYFVLLRPIFCEKWKIAPPIRKEPPLRRLNLRNLGEKHSEFWRRPFFFFFFFFFFGDHLILGGKNVKRLNLGFRPKNHSEFWRRPFFFFFFFWRSPEFWAEKTFEFPNVPRHFVSNFGQTV